MQNVLRAPLLTAHGFRHGFSTRAGGVSPPPYDSLNLATTVGDEPVRVAENLRRFAGWVGYAGAPLYSLRQVHGRDVHTVRPGDSPEQVRALAGDALLSPAGLALSVRSADCVPVLLADPETRWVGAVHAGWRGVVAGVVPAAVRELGERAPASRLLAALFPHIRRCCFEVDAAVAQQLLAAHPGDAAGAPAGDCGPPKPHVALDAIVRAQLLALGLTPGHIDDVPGCTCCEPARFFSYRRDGAASGRHLAAILG